MKVELDNEVPGIEMLDAYMGDDDGYKTLFVELKNGGSATVSFEVKAYLRGSDGRVFKHEATSIYDYKPGKKRIIDFYLSDSPDPVTLDLQIVSDD